MNLTLSTPPLPIHKQTIKNKNKIKNPTSLIKLADTIQIMEDADTNQIMEDARMFWMFILIYHQQKNITSPLL